MSRVSRDEMLRLLGVPVARSAEVASSEVSEATAPAKPQLLTSLHYLLGRALPRLWKFAQGQPEARETRMLRRKLRELISWLVLKEGHRVRTSVATPYCREGANVRGRLELLIESVAGVPLLALESDWTGEAESLAKLEAWHRKGVAVLWIVGCPCVRENVFRLRSLANRTLRQSTLPWLAIYHLEHGWIWSGSPRPVS